MDEISYTGTNRVIITVELRQNHTSNINEQRLLQIFRAKRMLELQLYLHNPFACFLDNPSLIKYGKHFLSINKERKSCSRCC